MAHEIHLTAGENNFHMQSEQGWKEVLQSSAFISIQRSIPAEGPSIIMVFPLLRELDVSLEGNGNTFKKASNTL